MNCLEEIKAETLVAASGVEQIDDLHIRSSGIFYRNYLGDCMHNERNTLRTSRNSIAHLLPEGLFLKENALKKTTFQEQHDKIKEVKENTAQFFQPFDTEFFRLTFGFEKNLQAIADKGNGVFLPDFVFEGTAIESHNPYIRRTMALLPFIYTLKGNIAFLKDVLKYVLSAQRIDIIRKNPFFIRFIIHKERLSKKQYVTMDREVAVFFNFFQQWFLPVEVEFDFRIKDYTVDFNLEKELILDYNTHLK